MAPPDPFDTDFEHFADAELLSWFDDNIAGTVEFESTLELSSAIGGVGTPGVDDALAEGIRTLLRNESIAGSSGSRNMINRVDWSAAFARLGRDSRLKILQGWDRQHAAELVFLKDPTDIDVDFGPVDDPDPTWQSDDIAEVIIALPDGTKMVSSSGSNPDYIPTDYVVPADPDPMPTPSSNTVDLSKWKVQIGLGGVLGALLIAGFVFIPRGGETGAIADLSGELGDTSAGQEPETPAQSVAAKPCDVIREEQIVLDLSSPDVQPVISLAHGREANNFMAPALNWSTVPDETVEIALSVQLITGERADRYSADPLLWWRGESTDEPGSGGVPIGSPKWLVTGIAPSASGLPQSSQTIPLPDGAVERSVGGTQAMFNGVTSDSMFIGPGLPGERYLFSVFALCESMAGANDDLSAGFLGRSSIATGWFVSEYAPE